MTSSTQQLAGDLGVAMFTIADQDEAIRYYTEVLGFELRADVPFAGGTGRWVEVAPVGSTARLALNPPMGGGQPGGGGIGIAVADVDALHAELAGRGVAVMDLMEAEEGGAPRMFMAEDPDGNHLAFTQI